MVVYRKISGISRQAAVKPEVLTPLQSQVYQERLKQVQTTSAIYPLNSPGIPQLTSTSDFMQYAKAIGDVQSGIEEKTLTLEGGKKKKEQIVTYGDTLYEVITDAMRTTGFKMPVTIGPHRTQPASFVPGHLWGSDDVTGPRKSRIMIINKMPWVEECSANRCFAGAAGQLFLDACRRVGIPELSKIYVTHLVKFMPPNWQTNLKAAWIRDGLHLLYNEIKIVQPEFILCVGSDAVKALLSKAENVTTMDGRVEDFTYDTAFSATASSAATKKVAKLMCVYHPKAALQDMTVLRQLDVGLTKFYRVTQNASITEEEEIERYTIYDRAELKDVLTLAEKECEDNVIAVDAEWEGDHPVNAGSYLRTIQLSWLPFKAAGIVTRKAGGAPIPGLCDETGSLSTQTLSLLNAFFNGGEYEDVSFRPKRIVGHFFNADLEWLDAAGLKLQKGFSCPLHDLTLPATLDEAKSSGLANLFRLYDKVAPYLKGNIPAWYRTKYEGGADTGLMAHAVEETAVFGLEVLAMRYTSAPRYEKELHEWIVDYCKDNGISKSELGGYGNCPDDILLPYGMYDADVTLRLFYALDTLLDSDYEGNNCREAFWESQIAAPAVLEIHQTGITLDKERINFLTDKFVSAMAKLESQLREEINWPEFNLRSTQHVRELLFGYELNGKLDKDTGKCVRIRPLGAVSLQLTPLFTTSKPPKPWSQIQESGKEHEHSPSTDKQSLSLLAQSANSAIARKVVGQLRDCRFLDQVLKTTLRPPSKDSDTGEYVRTSEGDLVYTDGFMEKCCDDGRLRTHIYQTKETGRWSSARPNLQNISKKRDPDYKRLLKEDYKYALRSILKAAPGHVLIEADYIGAELFGMAVMAGDSHMIEHAIRNQLPDTDSEFYDIHSNVSCFAFNLKCEPTKAGLKGIGKSHLRIVAKSVIFGIAYGRGARAIATAAKEEGIEVTVAEAQAVIDAIFNMYPRLKPFFQECRERATGRYIDPRTKKAVTSNTLCNCYGRFRRFPDMGLIGDSVHNFERQAMNYPIQSLVASAVSRAIAYMCDYRKKVFQRTGHDMYRIVLQIHDAILLEVPFRYVKYVCEHVFPTYMRQKVPIYPATLDGIPTGAGPYYLGLDIEVMNHWGEKLTAIEASQAKIPVGGATVSGCSITYSNNPVIPKKKKKGRRK